MSVNRAADPIPFPLRESPTALATSALVLVVDDDWVIRGTVAEALEAEGYATVRARVGADAVELVRTARPDVVLLALSSSASDPPAIVAAHEAILRSPAPVIAMLTAPCPCPVGIAVMLLKPFDLDELLEALQRVGVPLPAVGPCAA